MTTCFTVRSIKPLHGLNMWHIHQHIKRRLLIKDIYAVNVIRQASSMGCCDQLDY